MMPSRDSNGLTPQQARLWCAGELCFWLAMICTGGAVPLGLITMRGWQATALIAVGLLFAAGHSWLKDRVLQWLRRDIDDLLQRGKSQRGKSP